VPALVTVQGVGNWVSPGIQNQARISRVEFLTSRLRAEGARIPTRRIPERGACNSRSLWFGLRLGRFYQR
jgi:hypothetical protein